MLWTPFCEGKILLRTPEEKPRVEAMADEDVLVAATTVVPDGEAFEDDAEWVEAVVAQEVRTIGAGSEVVQHDTTAEVSRAGTPVGARVGVGDDGCAPTSAVEGGTHLQLSSRSGTGYAGVYKRKCPPHRFYARRKVDGRAVHLGTFETARAAAEAEGLELVASSSNETGYKGVKPHPRSATYQVQHWTGKGGTNLHLGCFPTVVEAADSESRSARKVEARVVVVMVVVAVVVVEATAARVWALGHGRRQWLRVAGNVDGPGGSGGVGVAHVWQLWICVHNRVDSLGVRVRADSKACRVTVSSCVFRGHKCWMQSCSACRATCAHRQHRVPLHVLLVRPCGLICRGLGL